MSMNETLAELLKIISKGTSVVSCPALPALIPGIVAADIFDANDCFGTLIELKVPKSGVIYSATLLDFDYEGTQVDLEVFREQITTIASDAPWAPSDEDMIWFLTEIAFVSFDGHTNSYTSEVTNIGKAYTAPGGSLWIQAVCRGTPTIAAGKSPRFQLQILSSDLEWSGG